MTKADKPILDYLKSLPADRQAALSTVRETILKYLPPGYEEVIQYGMISYVVPHSIYPAGYHCTPELPLPFASLGSQKNHMAIYLHFVYANPTLEAWLRSAFAAAGLKLDFGKSCLRFKKLEDLPLRAVGQLFAKVPVPDYIAAVEKSLQDAKTAAAARKAKKAASSTH